MEENSSEFDDEDDVSEADDQKYMVGHILPRPSTISVHLVSNRAGIA